MSLEGKAKNDFGNWFKTYFIITEAKKASNRTSAGPPHLLSRLSAYLTLLQPGYRKRRAEFTKRFTQGCSQVSALALPVRPSGA